MDKPAIIIEGVWKSYERGRVRKRDLKSTLTSGLPSLSRNKESFFALKDINLVVPQGELLGIIGPNGAGKSTLLKLLSRITYPDKGRMVIHGTLSSMLEVGTGFHPELTGRENIFLNGAIIGMRREEVSRKLDSIIAFSGLEEFIDTPVKHFSSGMYVRLAFSVASHLEPDILLIDEVLAVGDQEFRKKCLEKIMDVSGQGRTIIMVSHQMSYLRKLCSHGVYLNSGSIKHQGPIEDVINHYVDEVDNTSQVSLQERPDRKGTGILRLVHLTLLDDMEQKVVAISAGQSVTFQVDLESSQDQLRDIEIRFEFYDIYGHLWFMSKNSISGNAIMQAGRKISMQCHFPKFPLNKNFYYLNAAVQVQNELSDEIINALSFEVEHGKFYETGKLPPSSKGFLAEYHWTMKEPA